MKLQTQIPLSPLSVRLEYDRPVLTMGSCFSEAIGQRLRRSLFDCVVNPFGILFNPASILSALSRLFLCIRFEPDAVQFFDGCWHSLLHHGRFSSPDRSETLRRINAEAAAGAAHLNAPSTLLLTFGTSYVYRHKATNRVVANCHKMPAADFVRECLTVDEIVRGYSDFLEQWLAGDARRRVVLTVSPVRHLNDGLHENRLSKSILLLAVDELQKAFPDRTAYFPAYEILLDELRDYRFYASDLLHPSEQAEEYIFECFAKTAFSAESATIYARVEEYMKMKSHRFLHPLSDSAARFRERLQEKEQALLAAYPFLVHRLQEVVGENL